MWKHCLIEHDGSVAEFEMKMLRSFKSCLERQVNEAVRIMTTSADIVLNSKSEFRQAPIIRVVPTNGLQEEQEEASRSSTRARGFPGAGRGGRGLARGRTLGGDRRIRKGTR